ncbi:MAG: hypothetical protein ACI9EF_000145 [Pseudohongiellaceae bacterium]|jgi:hypothetical protein
MEKLMSRTDHTNASQSPAGSVTTSNRPYRWRTAGYVAALAITFLGGVFALGDLPLGEAFEQLDELLPTPNTYRTASGAPGHAYWQQRVDYAIDATLDDEGRRINGSETITYHNNSPDILSYLWVQLDPNIFSPDSHAAASNTAPGLQSTSYGAMAGLLAKNSFDGTMKITSVRGHDDSGLSHTIVGTMMRVDLAQPLQPSEDTVVHIDWNHNINDHDLLGGRTGYEYFEEDGNCIYEIAHWFPRLAAYTDVNGWQNKPFLGRGEFTLEFGDYLLRITAPDNHVVAASGVLQNPEVVLSAVQRTRLDDAAKSETPSFVITPEEALENESSEALGTKTWIFKADNVRDVAFASSAKFIWDAAGQPVEDRTVLCMSYYPKEGEPLWSRYSTHAIAHTIEVYGKFAFPYPYPIAISVNGPIGGMEYPMICFNGPRPEDDGTYSERTKYGLISVIIHEVGHNWFPMIVNSDERQWTWMDEGLNTFLQYLTEQEWEDDYPSRRGDPDNIVSFMTSENQVPIMTNSEALQQFGSNAYAKPATALNILRETVMGRELFDFAFRTYSERWRFKRPEPADFFRTLEDASSVDLDWFWRAWFFTTDHVDMGIDGLRLFTVDSRDPTIEKLAKRKLRDAEPATRSATRNADLPKRSDRFPELLDFYNEFDDLDITAADVSKYEKLLDELDADQQELLSSPLNFYVIDLVNLGGIAMPAELRLDFEDGSTEELRIPAEIWRRDPNAVAKLFITEKTLSAVILDPRHEVADADTSNNRWPPEIKRSTIRLTERDKSKNPMQRQRDADEEADKEEAGSDG